MKLLILLSSFKESFALLRQDKKIIFFFFIPVLISFLLSVASSYFLIGELRSYLSELMGTYVKEVFWVKILGSLLIFALSIFFLFLTNWIFLLLVSLFSFPFTAINSRLVEEKLSETTDIPAPELSFLKSFLNEVKKIILLIFFMVLSFILTLIPFTFPLGFFLSALLMSVQFLDINWSRHELSFSSCLSNLRQNWGIYFVSGTFFLMILSIPILNAFLLPYGAVYYSVLWLRLGKHLPNGKS